MGRDRAEQGVPAGGVPHATTAYLRHQGSQPFLLTRARPASFEMAGADGGEPVYHRDQVPCRSGHLPLVQGHPRPGVDGTREYRGHLVEEDRAVAALPLLARPLQLLADPLGEFTDPERLPEKAGEQRLAMAVPLPVQGVHGSAAEECVDHRPRQGVLAVHVVLVVEEPHGGGSVQGDDPFSHQTCADGRSAAAAPAVGQPGVSAQQERKGVVDHWFLR